MNKYTFTKTVTFNEEDMVDIISSAVYDIGYWSVIDNDNDTWNNASAELSEDATFEDVFWHILKSGKAVTMYDVEDEDEVWQLTLDKLNRGIQMALNYNRWNGNMDDIDGEVGDVIFQFALFEDIVYG